MRRLLQVACWIALAGLLLGLISGGLGNARAAAARQRCKNNLKQIGLALENYHDSMGEFPPGTHHVPALPPERRLSWMFEIDPFVHARMDPDWNKHQDEPWDSEGNLRLIRGRMPWFECQRRPEIGGTSYVGVAGVGSDAPLLPTSHSRAGVFGYDRRITRGDVTDGLSETAAVIETASEGPGPWVAGGPSTVRPFEREALPYLGRGRPFGGNHRNGVMVAMADGSVHFVSDSVADDILEALATIAGGERFDIPTSD